MAFVWSMKAQRNDQGMISICWNILDFYNQSASSFFGFSTDKGLKLIMESSNTIGMDRTTAKRNSTTGILLFLGFERLTDSRTCMAPSKDHPIHQEE